MAGDQPLDAAARSALDAAAQTMAARRCACSRWRAAPRPRVANAEGDLTLLGLVGMIDPPRARGAAGDRRPASTRASAW
jgi:magnesium-transporting ATPase (P-type)